MSLKYVMKGQHKTALHHTPQIPHMTKMHQDNVTCTCPSLLSSYDIRIAVIVMTRATSHLYVLAWVLSSILTIHWKTSVKIQVWEGGDIFIVIKMFLNPSYPISGCERLTMIEWFIATAWWLAARTFRYSLSNVITADEKFTLFHQYLRYRHKCDNIVFSIPSAITWA